VLRNEKIYLRVSDYGPVSKNVKKIIDVFNQENIYYDVEKILMWQDCGRVVRVKRSLIELENTYRVCCANKTLTLLKNILYICPFYANADNLGLVPKFTDGKIEILPGTSYEEIRNTLNLMLRESKYFNVCKYCLGRPLGDLTIPAAIQLP
jgi:hypothetical protein